MGNLTQHKHTSLRLALAASACAAIAASCGLLAGCNTASATVERADYATALNRYYQGRPSCLWSHTVSFPTAALSPDEAKQQGFDALVDTGLLSRKRAAKISAQDTTVYDLTPEGRSALDHELGSPTTGNFCYGHRTVVAVDRDHQNSPTTEKIDFHYHVAQPASWATEISIQRAFPQVAQETSQSHPAQAILLDTDAGWRVSRILNP